MASLFTYLKQAQRLLRENRQELVDPEDLIDYINSARGQVAGKGECIRVIGTINTVLGQRAYQFSGIGLGTPSSTGVQGIINVRRINYNSGSGQIWFQPRSWPWFDLYHLNTANPASGPPHEWAQYGQGSGGSFYIDPLPDGVYTLNCDCVCFPINLATDTDVEAIPYLWTDAVPYFSAYLAMLNMQNQEAAGKMMKLYEEFMGLARAAANPSVNRYLYPQAVDPIKMQNIVGPPARGAV